jgi:hypothetical protein
MPGRRRRTSTTTRRSTSAATRTRAAAAPAKRAPARRAPAKAAGAAARTTAGVPVPGPGERVWVLAVPFRAPAPGAQWHKDLQAHVWVGARLPPELQPYEPGPYTLERFL